MQIVTSAENGGTERADLRKQEQKDTSIKILNSSGITVNDEQEVVKEVERFWGNLFCTNGKVTLGQKKEMIGNGMTSEGQIFRSAGDECCNKENERE